MEPRSSWAALPWGRSGEKRGEEKRGTWPILSALSAVTDTTTADDAERRDGESLLGSGLTPRMQKPGSLRHSLCAGAWPPLPRPQHQNDARTAVIEAKSAIAAADVGVVQALKNQATPSNSEQLLYDLSVRKTAETARDVIKGTRSYYY